MSPPISYRNATVEQKEYWDDQFEKHFPITLIHEVSPAIECDLPRGPVVNFKVPRDLMEALLNAVRASK